MTLLSLSCELAVPPEESRVAVRNPVKEAKRRREQSCSIYRTFDQNTNYGRFLLSSRDLTCEYFFVQRGTYGLTLTSLRAINYPYNYLILRSSN